MMRRTAMAACAAAFLTFLACGKKITDSESESELVKSAETVGAIQSGQYTLLLSLLNKTTRIFMSPLW